MEYSTISVLDYYKETLAYVGLPEIWLELGLCYVTLIGGKCFKLDLDWIENNNWV